MINERLKRAIAAGLDHPNVYMGGPSAKSLYSAKRILKFLLQELDDAGYEIRAKGEDNAV